MIITTNITLLLIVIFLSVSGLCQYLMLARFLFLVL